MQVFGWALTTDHLLQAWKVPFSCDVLDPLFCNHQRLQQPLSAMRRARQWCIVIMLRVASHKTMVHAVEHGGIVPVVLLQLRVLQGPVPVASQVTGVATHRPCRHLSPLVHRFPSLHGVLSGAGSLAHWPVASTHRDTVHAATTPPAWRRLRVLGHVLSEPEHLPAVHLHHHHHQNRYTGNGTQSVLQSSIKQLET